jgi:hypothetical protein
VVSKPVLLHIGTPKTGSTSIQDCLARAELDGGLGNVRYPLWGNDRHHVRLAPLYRPYHDLPPWGRHEFPADDWRFQRMRRQFRRFFFDELRSAGGAIISAEGLGGFAPELVARLRSDLESVGFNEFYIVLYVRDPADFFLSRTQQRLKTASEPQFVEDPVSFRYEFARAAETWEQIFPGRLVIRRFPTGEEHDVVDDFAAVLDECLGITLPKTSQRMNTTLSAEAMQILQDYRLAFWPDNGGFLTPDAKWLVRFLEQSRMDLSQTRPALRKDIAELIRANHQADAAKIFGRYGVDLGFRDLNSIAPPSDAPSCRANYRIDEIVESLDPEISYQLLLRLARAELGRRPGSRPLPVRAVARGYHAMSVGRRLPKFDSWLRSRISGL